MVMVVLVAVDKANGITVAANNTHIKITVVDLNNNPVHNAKVTVSGKSFYTDNNGYSPSIELQDLLNSYDADIKGVGYGYGCRRKGRIRTISSSKLRCVQRTNA